MTLSIEEYAVIGDEHTAAIVGANGSIDWLCLPDFDSPACFASLLGEESNGFFRLAPANAEDVLATKRAYRGDSLILETEFETTTGRVRVIDFMPVRSVHPRVIRVVEGLSGTVDMRLDLTVRFGYGDIVPWVTSTKGLVRFAAGPDALALWHRVHPSGEGLSTVADFTVAEGQRYPFTLVWFPSHEDPPPPLDTYYSMHVSDGYWQDWAARCTYRANGATRSFARSSLSSRSPTLPPVASWPQ